MMDRRLKNLAAEETGAVAVIVAVMLTVLIAVLALVADVGYMYEMRRQLQSAADAGALAAMTEKINGADPIPEALAYTTTNDLVGTPFRSNILDMDNSVFDQEDYVVVAVEKPGDLFFAPLFFGGSQMIRAKARARRVYVTGLRNLMPWGVVTIDPTDVQARLGNDDNTWESLSDSDGDGLWTGSLAVPDSAVGALVDVQIPNSQNYAEPYPDVAAVNVDQPGDSVSNVELTNNNLAPGGTAQFRITSTQPPSAVTVDNQRYTNFTDAGGNIYTLTLTAPSLADMTASFAAFPIELKVAQETYNNAAVLVVRDANSPVQEISVSPDGWLAPGTGSVTVNVRMREFEYGETYLLKLAADSVSGNFMSLNYNQIWHDDGTYEGYGGNGYQYSDAYGEWIYQGLPAVIHLGDTIQTQTGGGPQPQIEGWIDDRIDECGLDLATWEANNRPECGRLVVVPIVELKEQMLGNSLVVVNRFAAFFINSYVREGNEYIGITGQFVEYRQPGESTQDEQPSGLYVEAVRLEMP